MRQLHQDLYEDFRIWKNEVEELLGRQIEDYEFGEIMTQLGDEISDGLLMTLESSLDNNGYLDNPNQIEMEIE